MRTRGAIGAAIAALMALATATDAVAATPSLRVIPNPSVNGQQVTAHGAGFCPTPGCSPVTITVADQTVAVGVHVDPSGSFEAPFVVGQPSGQYPVTARQTDSAGHEITASTGIVVAAGDRPPTTNPATTTPSSAPVTSQPPNTQPTVTTTTGVSATTATPPTSAPAPTSTPPPASATPPATATSPESSAARTSKSAGTSAWRRIVLGLTVVGLLAGVAAALLHRHRPPPG